MSPLAAQADIRVLAFSNDASVATDGTFLLGFRPEEQVRRVVDYALASGALLRPEPERRCPGRMRPQRLQRMRRPRWSSRPRRSPPPTRARSIRGRRASPAWRRTMPTAPPRSRRCAAPWPRAAACSARPCSTRPISRIRRRSCGRSRPTTSARPRLEAERARLEQSDDPAGGAEAAGARDRGHDRRAAVRRDPAGRRRRQPALRRRAAHLLRRGSRDHALPRHHALAGRSARARRGGVAGRLVRGAGARRSRGIREPLSRYLRAGARGTRRARLRRHRARGGGRARSGRPQLRHDQPDRR